MRMRARISVRVVAHTALAAARTPFLACSPCPTWSTCAAGAAGVASGGGVRWSGHGLGVWTRRGCGGHSDDADCNQSCSRVPAEVYLQA